MMPRNYLAAMALIRRCHDAGITLEATDEGLAYDGPADAVSPLLDDLRIHKPDVLALLRDWPEWALEDTVAPDDWSQIRLAINQVRTRIAEFLAILRPLSEAEVVVAESTTPAQPTAAVCSVRCHHLAGRGSLHGGRSVRRDCGRCGRFLDFPVWNGQSLRRQSSLTARELSPELASDVAGKVDSPCG
jgi:hypothetical protein